MGKSAKGANFERELCKRLSLWWTGGKRDDVFWRSAGSGGMATNRAKRGGAAYGQYGDIQAVDPVGKPLMDVFVIELKRGYTKTSFADIFDKPAKSKQSQWESFVEQARRSAIQAGKGHWLLIQRRDRREAMVFMPTRALGRLIAADDSVRYLPTPKADVHANVRIGNKAVRLSISVMSLDAFLRIEPSTILKASHVD